MPTGAGTPNPVPQRTHRSLLHQASLLQPSGTGQEAFINSLRQTPGLHICADAGSCAPSLLPDRAWGGHWVIRQTWALYTFGRRALDTRGPAPSARPYLPALLTLAVWGSSRQGAPPSTTLQPPDQGFRSDSVLGAAGTTCGERRFTQETQSLAPLGGFKGQESQEQGLRRKPLWIFKYIVSP